MPAAVNAMQVADAVSTVPATKEMQDKLSAIGFDIAPMGSDAFGRYVRE
jgi:hypothetical protein